MGKSLGLGKTIGFSGTVGFSGTGGFLAGTGGFADWLDSFFSAPPSAGSAKEAPTSCARDLSLAGEWDWKSFLGELTGDVLDGDAVGDLPSSGVAICERAVSGTGGNLGGVISVGDAVDTSV